MAALLNRHHSEEIRQKIRVSGIIVRLEKHALGEIEMTATQIRAAAELLDRTVPKLSQVQLTGEDGGAIKVNIVNFSGNHPAL